MTDSATAPPHPATREYRKLVQDARSTARTVGRRLHSREVRIRSAAVHSETKVPPMISLLQGRGSSGLPLRLHVLCLWLAGSQGGGSGTGTFRPPESARALVGPHTTEIVWQDISDILLLPSDTPTQARNAQRRLKRAFDELAERRLIRVDGRYQRLQLLDDTGTGDPYTDPGTDTARGEGGWYFTLPHQFFENGWFSVLPAWALVTLLLYAERTHFDRIGRSRSTEQPVTSGKFLNEDYLSRYAPISKTTIRRGEVLLRNQGILVAKRERVVAPGFRSRNRHFPDFTQFKRDCPDYPLDREQTVRGRS